MPIIARDQRRLKARMRGTRTSSRAVCTRPPGAQDTQTSLSDMTIKKGEKMELTTLKQLYVDELKDLYSAENQLLKALPKMAAAATEPALKKGFETHLEETKGQVLRLE